jgi:membrane associated rhomboid family serine protease
MADNGGFWRSLRIVFGLVSVLWIVHIIQELGIFDFSPYANFPQHKEGLKGIIFSPFLHGSFEHLISNTLPIMVLLTVLLNAYPRVAIPALVFIHLTSGLLVWLFAPPNTLHIGISGIIYGIAAFLVAAGLFRKDRNSLVIGIFVALMYGGMVVGFLPQPGISWQSHLFGALSGVFIAYVFRKIDLPQPTEIELEHVEPDRHFFDNR